MKTSTSKSVWKVLFQDTIEEQFDEFCYNNDVEDNAENMLSYLLRHQLINTQNLKRYVIQQEFNKLLPKYGYHKTQTVLALSVLLEISERTIWSALHYHTKEKNKKYYSSN